MPRCVIDFNLEGLVGIERKRALSRLASRRYRNKLKQKEENLKKEIVVLQNDNILLQNELNRLEFECNKLRRIITQINLDDGKLNINDLSPDLVADIYSIFLETKLDKKN